MEKTIRKKDRIVAYFTMEVGLDVRIPTYSGGLGVLAGDTLKAAADLSTPLIGVTLLNEKGYFDQVLDGEGRQTEKSVEWNAADFMTLEKPVVKVEAEDREIVVPTYAVQATGTVRPERIPQRLTPREAVDDHVEKTADAQPEDRPEQQPPDRGHDQQRVGVLRAAAVLSGTCVRSVLGLGRPRHVRRSSSRNSGSAADGRAGGSRRQGLTRVVAGGRSGYNRRRRAGVSAGAP